MGQKTKEKKKERTYERRDGKDIGGGRRMITIQPSEHQNRRVAEGGSEILEKKGSKL